MTARENSRAWHVTTSDQMSRRPWRARRDAAAFRPACVRPSALCPESEQEGFSTDESEDSGQDCEDRCCYISLASAHEEDTILGLGLFAHRRTRRQVRLGLPPDLCFSLDYLDVSAFNDGLEAMRSRCFGEPALVTSSRSQLNAWLPIYIDSRHWSRARPYVESAVQAVAGSRDQVGGFPEAALTVCCSLLTRAAVSLSLKQGKVTERTVQMYADAHRLLLQLAHEWPELQQAAARRLRTFLSQPAARLRQATHSLGDLLHCLLIVDDLDWEDVEPALLPEALRRHVWRQECKGLHFDSTCFDGTAASLLSQWDTFAPDACKVLCFIAFYTRRFGRLKGKSLEAAMMSFDKNGGRLLPEAHAELSSLCSSLQGASLSGVLELLEVSHDNNYLAEMVLWAVRYGSSQGQRKKDLYWETMSDEGLQGPSDLCPLLHLLRESGRLPKCRRRKESLCRRQWRPKQEQQESCHADVLDVQEASDPYDYPASPDAATWSWVILYDYGSQTFLHAAWPVWYHYAW